MKKCFVGLCLLMFFGNAASVAGQKNGRCDSNCLKDVKWLLAQSKALDGEAFTSWAEKAAFRLGDRSAIGILVIYKKRDLTKAKNIKIFLPVIRQSFLYPQIIEREEDKRPDVSLALLRDLESKVSDASLKEDISETIKEIVGDTRKEAPTATFP